MIIDKQLLDTLSSQAKASPRLRQNYDLRNPSTGSGQVQSEDNSQRMLNRWSSESRRQNHLHYAESWQRKTIVNALEPGTVMPIHRHKKSSESIAIIRGKMIMRLYDDNGNVTDEFMMAPISLHSLPSIPEGECSEPTIPMVHVEAGQWHSLEVLEEGTVVFEAKDGKYETLSEEEIKQK